METAAHFISPTLEMNIRLQRSHDVLFEATKQLKGAVGYTYLADLM